MSSEALRARHAHVSQTGGSHGSLIAACEGIALAGSCETPLAAAARETLNSCIAALALSRSVPPLALPAGDGRPAFDARGTLLSFSQLTTAVPTLAPTRSPHAFSVNVLVQRLMTCSGPPPPAFSAAAAPAANGSLGRGVQAGASAAAAPFPAPFAAAPAPFAAAPAPYAAPAPLMAPPLPDPYGGGPSTRAWGAPAPAPAAAPRAASDHLALAITANMFGNSRVAGREWHRAMHAGGGSGDGPPEPPQQQPLPGPSAGVKRGYGEAIRGPQGDGAGGGGGGVWSGLNGEAAAAQPRPWDDDGGAGAGAGGAPPLGGFQSGRAALARDDARRHGGAVDPQLQQPQQQQGGGDDGAAPPRRGGPPSASVPTYSAPQAGAKGAAAGLRRQGGGFKPPQRGTGPGAPAAGGGSGPGGGGAAYRGSSTSPGMGGQQAQQAQQQGPGGVGAPVAGGRRGLLEEFTPDQLPAVLQHMDPKLIEAIETEIMQDMDPVCFDDIAGLGPAKAVMFESIVLPMLRPDLFATKLTRQAKGVLLYGPPGTGKTLIGKAVAAECGATFFYISASSLTSKYVGESEKLVRCLFGVAAARQPSVVFVDEVDSLLTTRGEGEHESSRRIKTEFLVQLDGCATRAGDFVLVIGATNRPGEIDEAARRRFVKRIYVPLPDAQSRDQLFRVRGGFAEARLVEGDRHALTDSDVAALVARTEGYSGADVTQVAKEAALCALRDALAAATDLVRMERESIPPLSRAHFEAALATARPSVSPGEVGAYETWHAQFGTQAGPESLAKLPGYMAQAAAIRAHRAAAAAAAATGH